MFFLLFLPSFFLLGTCTSSPREAAVKSSKEYDDFKLSDIFITSDQYDVNLSPCSFTQKEALFTFFYRCKSSIRRISKLISTSKTFYRTNKKPPDPPPNGEIINTFSNLSTKLTKIIVLITRIFTKISKS